MALPMSPKSSAIVTDSFALLSMISWEPVPTVRGSPTQLSFAPTPATGPEIV
jgi:hypothetical protein